MFRAVVHLQVLRQAARLDTFTAENQGRYGNLTTLDLPPEVTEPPPRVVKKQVDKKWLAQLDECRPTAQDLYVPDLEPVQRLGTLRLGLAPLGLLDDHARGAADLQSTVSLLIADQSGYC